MTPRSWLYVPGDAPDKLAKALDRGADALIVDLEDAVPVAAKQRARDTVREWLDFVEPELSAGDRASGGKASAHPQIWVRVNPGAARKADVRAVAAAPALTGLCVAKAETLQELEQLDGELTDLGSAASVTPLLESAAAVLRAADIARAPRVARLQIGEADLSAELGVVPGEDERELLWVRSSVVLASAAAGIEPPVGPVSTDFRDLDRLRASTEALQRLGYAGRACIHPAQVPVVNDVFTPSPKELAHARNLVARFDAAGGGAALGEDGRMIDEAVIRRSRRLLQQGRPDQRT